MLHLLHKSAPLRLLLPCRPPKPFFLPKASRLGRHPLFPRAAMGSVAGDASRLAYPPVRRDDSVVDNYHGVRIPDPYRWQATARAALVFLCFSRLGCLCLCLSPRRLEDPDSEETKEFVARQAELAETVLAGCPDRENLRREITRLFDHPRHGAPFRRGNKYFYFHNTGLQAQSVLYMQDDLDGKAEVLLDPNTLSKDGTVALSTYSISEDGNYIAYGVSESGSDWVAIHVMSITDKQPMPDKLSWVKFSSISWTHDGKGFFYGRYPAPRGGELDAGTETNINLNHQIYYHVVGSDQSEDILCWKDPDHPKNTLGASVTEDGKYIILYIYDGCDPVNKLYYCEMSSFPQGIEGFRGTQEMLPFVKLMDNFDAQYHIVANDGNEFTFLTNKSAPKNKLVRVNLKNPELWTDVLPEHEKDVLESADAVNNNQLLVCYMSDVKHILQLRDLRTGNLIHQLPLEIGSVSEISCRREDKEIFIGFTSFLSPGITYRCNLTSTVPEMKVFRETSVPRFDRTKFQVKQVFVPSKDGTKIPMFIMSKKDIKLDGSHPTLLYGYGGFNISLTPSFSVGRVVLCKNMGFVVCVANIRGGGEYGEEWHKAGALGMKQNCFDDFVACAEFLISDRYTSSKQLCIEGGSNGGLLIAASINQRPDLFGCALAHVGVMDMLRFHKFTIGHAWTTDYGCSDKEEEFHWLIKSYALLQSHSWYKPATLQYVLCASNEDIPQTNPIIGRIDRKSGHGAGRPTQKLIDEAADRYGFMAKMLGASWTD
ncbi:hypothetical protein EJB05_44464, partial [Eragrostis curvula]